MEYKAVEQRTFKRERERKRAGRRETTAGNDHMISLIDEATNQKWQYLYTLDIEDIYRQESCLRAVFKT